MQRCQNGKNTQKINSHKTKKKLGGKQKQNILKRKNRYRKNNNQKSKQNKMNILIYLIK